MATKFSLQHIVQLIFNDNFNCLQILQLEEAADHLKLFTQQHNLQNKDFKSFQDNLPSYISSMKMDISKNKMATSNTAKILIDIVALIETALIKDPTFHAIGIHLCRNTFKSNIFSSQQRIKCMDHIQTQHNNIDEIKDDLDQYKQSGNNSDIINELNVDVTEASKWVYQLNKAREKALKDQQFKPTPNSDPFRYIEDEKEEPVDRDRNVKFVTHYSQQDYQLIVDALITVMSDGQGNDGENISVRGMKGEDDVKHFKETAIKLMHICSPNQLGIIVDLIARGQLKYVIRHKKVNSDLDNCMRHFLVNKRGIPINNMKPLHRQGVVMKRMANFIPFITALYSQTKLKESPKPMQLVIALMMYRAELEIINAYKSIDYDEKHIKCIDTVCVYLPRMMDIIYQQLKSDKNKVVVQIQEKDYHDADFNKTDTFYMRIFGNLATFISKYGEDREKSSKDVIKEQTRKPKKKRFLLRIFILLGRDNKSKGLQLLRTYPRCIYSLEPMDDKIKTRIDKKAYKMLVDIEHPIHTYPVQLSINRYQSDALMLKAELKKILKPKSSTNPFKVVHRKRKKHSLQTQMKRSYDENLSSEDRLVCDLIDTHYTMFTTIIYSQRYTNGELFFTRKMYNLKAIGIIRFMEEDILKVLPKCFEENKLRNYLEKKQLDSIKKGRDVQKYCKDDDFKEYEQEFGMFNKSEDDKKNDDSDRNGNDDSDEDSDAVDYDNPLHFRPSIISEIMDGSPT